MNTRGVEMGLEDIGSKQSRLFDIYWIYNCSSKDRNQNMDLLLTHTHTHTHTSTNKRHEILREYLQLGHEKHGNNGSFSENHQRMSVSDGESRRWGPKEQEDSLSPCLPLKQQPFVAL